MSDRILFIGPGGETVTGPGEHVPPLLRAVHRRNGGCGKIVAVYRHGDGWTAGKNPCRCAPRPALPAGQELARWLARATLGKTKLIDL